MICYIFEDGFITQQLIGILGKPLLFLLFKEFCILSCVLSNDSSDISRISVRELAIILLENWRIEVRVHIIYMSHAQITLYKVISKQSCNMHIEQIRKIVKTCSYLTILSTIVGHLTDLTFLQPANQRLRLSTFCTLSISFFIWLAVRIPPGPIYDVGSPVGFVTPCDLETLHYHALLLFCEH